MSVYIKENPAFLKAAMDSMLQQTVQPEQIVLVKDGPLTDELNAVIAEYEALYSAILTVVVSEVNLGLGKALNLGLAHCRNELVARMDTDDIALPDRCEQQLAFFEADPAPDIVGGDIAEFINDVSNIVGKRMVPQTDKAIKEYLKKRCPFNHVSVMFKKSSVLDAGGYMDWFWNEDYYLWIRMYLNGAVFANTGTVLVNVRVGLEMYQRRGGFKYYKSEAELQKYMYKNKVIGFGTYFMNVMKRFIVQVLMPNRLRGWVFRKILRR
jgi:glycosyltransferase involved in cell wall biosynthesis